MTQPIEYAVPRAAIYYAPTARVDPLRLGIALPNTLVVAVLIGTAYGAGEPHIRPIYLRVAAAVVAAAALGALTGGMIRFARLHHRALAVLAGTLVGVVGLWASWVAWLWEVFRISSPGSVTLLDLAANPRGLYTFARFLYWTGAWQYRGDTVRGTPLLACWVIEALILVLGCTLVAAAVGKPGLFCPSCRKRCAGVGGLGRFDGTDASEVRQRLEAHDFDYLLTLGPVRDEDDPEVLLDLSCCPCGKTNVLGARRMAWEDNGQGQPYLKERPLVEGLLIGPEQVAEVRSLKARLQPKRSDALHADAVAVADAAGGDDDQLPEPAAPDPVAAPAPVADNASPPGAP